ncbi:MAG: hypothetical protein MK080_06305 [Opitutales bacterium]|nr:hypothetical protein [Opitutales bacterium]NRA27329.1 hypothetical protein [Opitutales bacterium]
MTTQTATATDSLVEQLESLYADRQELFDHFGVATVEEVIEVIRNMEDQLLALYAEGESQPNSPEEERNYNGEELWTKIENIFGDLAAVTAKAADEFDFGFIRMDDRGTVEIYNKWEMDLANMNRSAVLNRNFFKEIAPCTHNRLFYHNLHKAAKEGRAVDQRIEYTFTYKMEPTPVDIRLLRDPTRRKAYMLIKRM